VLVSKVIKGPQRSITQDQMIGNTAKDSQKTVQEHYGLSCRKLALIEFNGAFQISLILVDEISRYLHL